MSDSADESLGRVLVLGAHRHAPAVIRSLSRAGYHVVVGVPPQGNPAARSRLAAEAWPHPAIEDHAAFMAALKGFAQDQAGRSYVYPIGGAGLVCLAKNERDVPPTLTPVMPSPEVVLACIDKERACEHARGIGIPVPETRVATTLREIHEAAEAVRYPCLVKPNTSAVTVLGGKALVCPTRAVLEQALTEWPPGADRVLVQTYCVGRRHNCHFVARDGEIIACFEQLIIRTNRADATGLCVEGRSVPPTPDLWALCRRLAASLSYTGAACVQFLRSEDGDDITFLEINPRLCASCGFPVHCGVDMPRLALEAVARQRYPEGASVIGLEGAMGIREGAKPRYREGETMNWFLGDLTGVIDERGSLSFKARLGRLAQAIGSFARADVHVTWSASDPVPTLRMWRALSARLLGGVRRRLPL